MKNGILYFFRMDIISVTARFTLVFLLLTFSKLPENGSARGIAITVMVISFLLGIFHVHSGKYMRRIIASAEDKFVSDFRNHFGISEARKFELIKSYSRDERIPVSRKLDGEVIYPHMVLMSYYEFMDRRVVQVRVKSLVKWDTHEDFYYEIPSGESLYVKLEKIQADIDQYSVTLPEYNGKKCPAFPMRADFHLREFLALAGVKENV